MLEITPGFFKALSDMEPQALGITYWFDAAPDGTPYPVNVHFAGKRRDAGADRRKDSFSVVGTVERVLPGSGRIALTVRVNDLPTGTWDIVATPVTSAPAGAPAPWVPLDDPLLPSGSISGTTTFAPVARTRAPGVRLGAWPAMVTLGTVLALLVQGIMSARLGLPIGRLLPLSLGACLLGLVGAKVYYLLTHRSERRGLITTGLSVQGFVIFTSAVMLAGTLLLGLPVGTVFDVTVPGLLLGLAVGRVGCLLGGCCAGRPTTSRWAVWASNRRVGMRRIPVQPMESTLAGVLAGLSLAAVFVWGETADGAVFAAGLGAYIMGRQLLFPARETPRSTRYGRVVTLIASTVVTLGAVVALLLF